MNFPQGNPFSTRHVQPGSLEFLFTAGNDAQRLVENLRRAGWRGQVVGPHGAGKTTLLHALRPSLRQAGRKLAWVTLRGGQRRLPQELLAGWNVWDSQVLVIVDGYEQLARLSRWRLGRQCRRTGAGLLVTSHTDAGLPLLYQVQPSLPMVQQLVAQLLADQPGVLTRDEVAEAFEAWQGNVRELLFALYDLYELRRHNSQ